MPRSEDRGIDTNVPQEGIEPPTGGLEGRCSIP